MKAVIIDDEMLARSIVREYLQYHPDIEIVQECNDGFEGVKAIQQHQPDLVFLDIQMPKINGFEMLELLEQPPSVIFTTAFEEYAIRAFETHAVDYLLKPFSRDRFDKALQKWRQQETREQVNKTTAMLDTVTSNQQQNNRVVLKDNGKIKIIPAANIQYLEASDDYVKIHTAEGVFLKNKTMQHFEKTLDETQFVRIHRSYIINIQLITRLDPYEKESYVAVLSIGMKLPVSRAGYARLKEVLGL
ncbi:LytR/AlgR family response regulator transcription factor [Sediminibacterium ginsengisoli]|uniref:Two component transcriptional regulator, LytTR family n=1 Tax=Sediminibacterium ginsengisoli TaxID=413434 RepID=A0A1T4QGD5_9BACT|nr:LytTR family transcriptional regulator DNA-binding domain-containing protein [Sediminibacterium ginsengisoli]SKA02764.1 two component transcriptional regulator, LytTR family [Sediminibacterium ginsengisoli]